MPRKKAQVSAEEENNGAIRVINERYDPLCAIDSIVCHPDNPRQGDIGQIHESIDKNGFFGALLVQESTGYILAGNHTYRTIVQKGASTVPVLYVNCTDSEAKRIMIAANRIPDLASYDMHALAQVVEQIKFDETGLGYAGIGWDEEAHQNLLKDLDGKISPDAAEPEAKKPPTPEVKKLFNRAWTMIASEWQHIGTSKFKWLSPDVTPGVAAWNFVNAKYCGGDYARPLSLAFTPEQFSTAGDRHSRRDLLKKIAAGDEALADRLSFVLEKPKLYTLLAAQLSASGHRMPLDFPADIARETIQKYCKMGGAILDPCHGWGGRCVGFLLSNVADRYVGCDPSLAVHRGVEDLYKTLSPFCDSPKTAEFHDVPFEDFETAERFDMAFTSPPYYDVEKYDGAKSSFRRYTTFDSWVSGFYEPLIHKCYEYLKDDCYFILQVGSQTYPLAATAKDIAANAGFIFHAVEQNLLPSTFTDTEAEASESMLVFHKEKR